MDTDAYIRCHCSVADSFDRQELVSVEATSEWMRLLVGVLDYAAPECPLGVQHVDGDDETCRLVFDLPGQPSHLEPSFHYRQ